MMTFPFGRTVTVWREVQNRFGDETVTEERTMSGCALYPTGSTEGGDTARGGGEVGGDRSTLIVSELTMLCPPGSGITATHRVRLPDGSVWRVVGQPNSWLHPMTGWTPGEQVNLQRVQG
jgi:hypothetical protein